MKAGLSVVINDLIHVVGKFGLYLHPMECPRLIFSLCVCVCSLTQQGSVVCSEVDGQIRIFALGLQFNGLNGTLPESLSNLTALDGLNLAMNYHNLPWVGGLGGRLPKLPFRQYSSCGLEGNRFICPLPAGAAESCSQGQPLQCY